MIPEQEAVLIAQARMGDAWYTASMKVKVWAACEALDELVSRSRQRLNVSVFRLLNYVANTSAI